MDHKNAQKNKFLADWSVSRVPADKLSDQDINGFFKISGRKGKVRIYHDVDNNFKLNKKDELIGFARGGEGFGFSNNFGLVQFMADAKAKSVNGDKEFDFSYYFQLIPSEADSDVASLKVPVSSSFLNQQKFVGTNNMSVSDFENRIMDMV